jgi:hypothetical protein
MLIPAVDPNHLRKAWELMPDLSAQRCGGEKTKDFLERVLPDANVEDLLLHIVVLHNRTKPYEQIDFKEAAKEVRL